MIPKSETKLLGAGFGFEDKACQHTHGCATMFLSEENQQGLSQAQNRPTAWEMHCSYAHPKRRPQVSGLRAYCETGCLVSE